MSVYVGRVFVRSDVHPAKPFLENCGKSWAFSCMMLLRDDGTRDANFEGSVEKVVSCRGATKKEVKQ